ACLFFIRSPCSAWSLSSLLPGSRQSRCCCLLDLADVLDRDEHWRASGSIDRYRASARRPQSCNRIGMASCRRVVDNGEEVNADRLNDRGDFDAAIGFGKDGGAFLDSQRVGVARHALNYSASMKADPQPPGRARDGDGWRRYHG